MSVIWGRQGGAERFKAIKIPYPMQSVSLVYTGDTLTPTWQNYDESKMNISGTTEAVNAGSYKAIFTPREGYYWKDETIIPYEAEWVIEKVTLLVPSQSGSLTYNGQSQSPKWLNYDSNLMKISGTTSAIDANTYYYATFTLLSTTNYMWANGSSQPQKVRWELSRKNLGDATYTPSEVVLSLSSNPKCTIKVYNAGNTVWENWGVGIIRGEGSIYEWSDNMTSDPYPLEVEITAIKAGSGYYSRDMYTEKNYKYSLYVPITVTE